ncbi:hypothetical protein [Bythopirellula goksoeyrii]|uniref:Uncharacterized protein n=1 Tax=Bythopirellula goksoeyrii TaxID=1400387 RepID=A0A5B9QKZ2_9BACT|nr:hypothetical protein [Bythopirellula goksoeyrii]QEG34743.1 hypothetical protein Pr1d_20250 [Bythopirellula goksoeyrii]
MIPLKTVLSKQGSSARLWIPTLTAWLAVFSSAGPSHWIVGTIQGALEARVSIIGYNSYRPLVQESATFFRSRQPLFSSEQIIERFAFMEAVEENKRPYGT